MDQLTTKQVNPTIALFSARVICLVLLVFVFYVESGHATEEPRFIHYLQVEANEGNSSGGHTALRFDKVTFHFQHENSGIIRIKRLDSKTFDHMYGKLGNRAIRESWIKVSAETFTLLLDGFNQFLLIQDEQLSIMDSLHQDVTLFDSLLGIVQGDKSRVHPLRVNGLGYFQTPVTRPAPQSSGSLPRRIDTMYGDNFIAQRTVQVQATLRSLKLEAMKTRLPVLSADIYPVVTGTASATYTDAVSALHALQLLQTTPHLAPGSYWSSDSSLFTLTAEETHFLRSFAAKIEDGLVRLVNSPRSDWGFPFMVGLARLAAIEASLESGRLQLLDLYPPTELPQNSPSFKGRRYLPLMKQEAEELFSRKRKEFFAGQEMREADFAALEFLGNNLLELERVSTSGGFLRSLPELPVPMRPALVQELILPDMSKSDLLRERDAALSAEKDYAQAVASLYEYDILRRNCVTEIFTFINKSLLNVAVAGKGTKQAGVADTLSTVREESLKRLGGYIDATQGLTFIPFVSAKEVDACYSVTANREQPSYRAAQLAEMKKHESSLLVYLRECNTITSTIYQRPPDDSPFLFFTDDAILLRPVFGVFNLLAGIGESLLGLITLPLEGPDRLYLGAKGVLFSLPELIFINLRKGTMEYVAEIH